MSLQAPKEVRSRALGTERGRLRDFELEEPGEDLGFSGSASDLGGEAGRDLDSEIASLSQEAPIADLQAGPGSGETSARSERATPKPPPRVKRRRGRRPLLLARPKRNSSLSSSPRLRSIVYRTPCYPSPQPQDRNRGYPRERSRSDAQQSKLVWALVDRLDRGRGCHPRGTHPQRCIPIPKGQGKRTCAPWKPRKGPWPMPWSIFCFRCSGSAFSSSHRRGHRLPRMAIRVRPRRRRRPLPRPATGASPTTDSPRPRPTSRRLR